jgi:hypothetical protein
VNISSSESTNYSGENENAIICPFQKIFFSGKKVFHIFDDDLLWRFAVFTEEKMNEKCFCFLKGTILFWFSVGLVLKCISFYL